MFRTSEAIDNKFWNKENKRKVQRKKLKKRMISYVLQSAGVKYKI